MENGLGKHRLHSEHSVGSQRTAFGKTLAWKRQPRLELRAY